MAYNQTTLADLTSQIGDILDDPAGVYWTTTEKTYAIWEFLRFWGATTSYWRTRGEFSLTPGQPYYELSVQLPTLRSRSYTLNQLVQEMQYHLLEAPNGISGAGMSGQVSISSILNAVQRARNQFVLDALLPYTVPASNIAISDSPDGLVQLPSSCIYLHRAAWIDRQSGTYTNLWRQDAWDVDHSTPLWTIDPATPQCYSESQLAPIQMQLAPVPIAVGDLELITIDSFDIDMTDPNATFNVPDEWVHAVKYCALSDVLGADSQLNDPMRAQYAQMRYDQSMNLIRDVKSMTRAMIGNVPLTIDSFAALDSSLPTWRNQPGKPFISGVQYDFLALAPVPDQAYSVTVDVVQSAPIPTDSTSYIQLGYEDLDNLLDYCTHYLLFKCGGTNFQSTFAGYDSVMKQIAARGQINKVKIQYLDAVFGQGQKDQRERPDQKPDKGK